MASQPQGMVGFDEKSVAENVVYPTKALSKLRKESKRKDAPLHDPSCSRGM
jgi:hypothetical protein